MQVYMAELRWVLRVQRLQCRWALRWTGQRIWIAAYIRHVRRYKQVRWVG